jgi:hypothetical protein
MTRKNVLQQQKDAKLKSNEIASAPSYHRNDDDIVCGFKGCRGIKRDFLLASLGFLEMVINCTCNLRCHATCFSLANRTIDVVIIER